jgi:hypothetical protein
MDGPDLAGGFSQSRFLGRWRAGCRAGRLLSASGLGWPPPFAGSGQCAAILGVIEAQVHITLVELAEMLQSEHGARFAPRTVWHFLDRDTMIVKKQRTRVSKSGPTSRPSDAPDSTLGLTSTPSAWSSSTRPAPRPEWLDYAGGPDAVSAAVLRSRTAIGRRPPSPAHSACQAWQGLWSSAGP